MKNKFSMALSLAVILAMIVTAVVLADQVSNNLDLSVDSNFEVMPLNLGGSDGTTTLRIIEQNGDGKSGCNLTGSGSQLTVSVASSNPSVASVSPTSITFNACGDTRVLTVTPVAEGSADITLTFVSVTTNSGGVTSSSFDLLPGRFTVNVAPPPNTAPIVTVTGVTHGTNYEFDTVPAAGCSVEDTEDGNSNFAATLSAISGSLNSYGLGTQTATCSYTDAGGINVTVEATYEIVDTTAPTITFDSRTPAANGNGWNNADVTVDWSCTDNVAVVSSAVSQVISSEGINQSATGTCTDLVGLTDSDTQSGINIDKQNPTITASANPLPNEAGWNNSDVTITYSCVDNGLSGVDAAASDLTDDVLTSSGTATRVCVDMAGNSDSASYAAQIDKDVPEFNCSVPADVWYGDNVDVACTASDGGSGLTSLLDGNFTLSTSVSDGVETNSAQTDNKILTDMAGNSTTVGPFTFKVDRKDPEVSCGSADSVWHNNNRSVSCSATDGGSGPASQNATLSTDIAAGTETDNAFTNSHEFSDAVGNTVTAGPVGPFKIDRKAPSVSAAPDRSADFGGWYSHALTITFSGVDGGADGVTCDPAVNYSGPDDASASVSGSCADAVGNSASASFEFRYDDTYPAAALSVTAGTAGTNGWYTSDVTILTSGTGSVSGVTCTENQVQTDETIGATFNGSCTSGAGLTTNAAPLTVKLDKTGPTAVLSASGTLGNNDWYISDVAITTSGADDISTPVTCTTPQSQTTDTASATFHGSCTNDAGLITAADALTIKRDATVPIITAAVSPVRPGSGWWNIVSGAPTVTYSCSDGTSETASCTSPFTFGQGENQMHNGTAVDNAGNSASAGVNDIDVDLTAPSVSAALDRSLAASGWFNASTGAPTVEFSCSDTGSSGLAYCPSDHLFGEGENQIHGGTSSDNAGNTASAGVSDVDVDTIVPSISVALDRAAAVSGWFNETTGAPVAQFTCSDATSGVVACPVNYTFGNGENQSHSGSVSDNAGNSNSASVSNVHVDLIDPTLIWNGGPANGASFYFGSVPAAPICSAADALSGENGCAVSGYGTTVGSHTMTAAAQDMAGNEYTEQRSYTVMAWTLTGFYQPVDMNNVLNVVRNGSTVPLKFDLFAGSTELTDVAAVNTLTYAQVVCGGDILTDEIETLATGGTSLRYDTTSGQFIFNWKTPSGTAGRCFRVTMLADDGSSLVAYFKMR